MTLDQIGGMNSTWEILNLRLQLIIFWFFKTSQSTSHVEWANLLHFIIFAIFQNNEITGCLYVITFIFDRCYRSWAAETPNKYECGWKYLTYTFVWIKISRRREINEWIFSNPHTCWISCPNWQVQLHPRRAHDKCKCYLKYLTFAQKAEM